MWKKARKISTSQQRQATNTTHFYHVVTGSHWKPHGKNKCYVYIKKIPIAVSIRGIKSNPCMTTEKIQTSVLLVEESEFGDKLDKIGTQRNRYKEGRWALGKDSYSHRK